MVSCSTLSYDSETSLFYMKCLFFYSTVTLCFFPFFFSTSCLLTRWRWRCQRRSHPPLTCPLKHQPCCQNTCTCTHTPPYAFLPSLTNPFLNTTMPLTFLPHSLSDLLCICKATENVLFNPSVCVSVEHPGGVRGERWDRLKSEWMNVMFDLQQKLPAPLSGLFLCLSKRDTCEN